MKNWNQYEITTNFDKSLIIISWDGINLTYSKMLRFLLFQLYVGME